MNSEREEMVAEWRRKNGRVDYGPPMASGMSSWQPPVAATITVGEPYWTDENVAEFVNESVILALRECANLVCPGCASNLDYLVRGNGYHTDGEYCPVMKIHAKISALEAQQ